MEKKLVDPDPFYQSLGKTLPTLQQGPSGLSIKSKKIGVKVECWGQGRPKTQK